MVTTRIQILGWIDHCEHAFPGRGTFIPTWLASMAAVDEAIEDGEVQKIGSAPFLPREGQSFDIYGLTNKGRAKLLASYGTADSFHPTEEVTVTRSDSCPPHKENRKHVGERLFVVCENCGTTLRELPNTNGA